MSRSTRPLARVTAAALTVAATATIAASPGSAATKTEHYQRLVQLNCNGSCIAKLPQLPANRALDIDHVVCEVNTGGDVVGAYLMLVPESLHFSMPLNLVWKRSFSNVNIITLGGEVNVRVPLGRQAQVQMLVEGAPIGSCSFTGTLLISS